VNSLRTTSSSAIRAVGANQLSNEPVLIALASNERYFPGLYCAVASALLTVAPTRRAALQILDGGVSTCSKARLERMVSLIRPDTATKWLPVDEALFHEAPLGPGNSRMAYARIVLPDLLEASKCVYLDCDTLVFRDVAELFDSPLKRSAVLAAVPDSETLTLGDDAPLVASAMGLSAGDRYYNSGVLLMDLDQLRRENFLRQSLEFLRVWKGKYRYWDQSAINFLLHDRIDELPGHWNRASWLFDAQEDNHLDCVLHYTSSAPWLGGKPGPAQAVFERFAEDAGVPVERDSPAFLKSRRQWLSRNALAPLRAVAFPAVSLLHKLVGREESSAAYRKAARYWFEFIRNGPARRRLHSRRTEQIREMRFGGAASLSSP
jgi:lipopolysaccharide biosynthesis glycosyltransferase